MCSTTATRAQCTRTTRAGMCSLLTAAHNNMAICTRHRQHRRRHTHAHAQTRSRTHTLNSPKQVVLRTHTSRDPTEIEKYINSKPQTVRVKIHTHTQFHNSTIADISMRCVHRVYGKLNISLNALRTKIKCTIYKFEEEKHSERFNERATETIL